jgi:hypothetical protein
MLFTRCGNGGISHNPLETMTADDAEIVGAGCCWTSCETTATDGAAGRPIRQA